MSSVPVRDVGVMVRVILTGRKGLRRLPIGVGTHAEQSLQWAADAFNHMLPLQHADSSVKSAHGATHLLASDTVLHAAAP